MKKIVFIIFILSNRQLLLAQDCIPNPANYSISIINCLKYKTRDSLNTKLITWKDIEPLYDSILSDDNNNRTNDSMPSRDSAQAEIEVKLVQDMKNNIDTLLKRGERIGINWKKIVFKNDASRIVKEKDLPSDLWFNDGKMEFSSGDSLYELSYKAMLIKGDWKLVDIGTSLNLYDKEGNELGVMSSSFNDFSKQEFDTTAAIMDSTMPSQPTNPTTKNPANKKHSVSSSGQQSFIKLEQ